MSIHGTQNNSGRFDGPAGSARLAGSAGAARPARAAGSARAAESAGSARSAGVHTYGATISLIGDDGTQFGAPSLPREFGDPQPELPPVRLTCSAGCACWNALESGEVRVRGLTPEELLEWMAALAGPLRSPVAHKRMYHHVRSTQPESPLNVGYVGVARGLASFGMTPAQYALLQGKLPCPVAWSERHATG